MCSASGAGDEDFHTTAEGSPDENRTKRQRSWSMSNTDAAVLEHVTLCWNTYNSAGVVGGERDVVSLLEVVLAQGRLAPRVYRLHATTAPEDVHDHYARRVPVGRQHRANLATATATQ